jgi:hypothetical protein
MTPWIRVFLEKPISSTAFHGTWRFITAITEARHLYTILWRLNPIHASPSHVLKTIILRYYSPIYTWVFQVASFPQVSAPKLCRFVVAGSCRQPQTYVKPEAAITVFELLMMSGVSLETCWAIKKHWNNKFYYTVVSFLLFLYDLYYDTRIHEHQVE